MSVNAEGWPDVPTQDKGQYGSVDANWERIETAPFDRDLELAVIENNSIHRLVFACRRLLNGWVRTETRERISVHPTHWREWSR